MREIEATVAPTQRRRWQSPSSWCGSAYAPAERVVVSCCLLVAVFDLNLKFNKEVPCCVARSDVVVGGHWWLLVGVFKKRKRKTEFCWCQLMASKI
jgi:hypothetical protein